MGCMILTKNYCDGESSLSTFPIVSISECFVRFVSCELTLPYNSVCDTDRGQFLLFFTCQVTAYSSLGLSALFPSYCTANGSFVAFTKPNA